jgi:hypothetical protein
MFSKITAEVTAVGLALIVLALSATQAKATELTEAQMDQITAGAFQVVGGLPPGGLGNLQDISNNVFVRQADPTKYLLGTVEWTGNVRYFDGTAPGLPTVTPYAVGKLVSGTQMNTGGFVVPPGYPT